MQLNLSKEFNLLVKRAIRMLARKRSIVKINYNTDDYKKQIIDNLDFLTSLVSHSGNIYALWVRENDKTGWYLVYIGQRKSACMRSRLIQHLFKKSAKTGSQLVNVKEAVTNNFQIGVTYIHVHPDELRTSVEEKLISIMKAKGFCSWNIHN